MSKLLSLTKKIETVAEIMLDRKRQEDIVWLIYNLTNDVTSINSVLVKLIMCEIYVVIQVNDYQLKHE